MEWRSIGSRSSYSSQDTVNLKEHELIDHTREQDFTLIPVVVRHWNMLSRETVDVLFLEMFNARLDGVLSNLV